MRTIAVVTTSRADYGILYPVLRCVQAHPALALRLVVSGSHLSSRFGLSVRQIEADGFDIAARIEVLEDLDTAEATTAAMARGVAGFGRYLATNRPDLLFVIGDRFEMHAAVLAALPFLVPVAHLHGGERSSGAFDDALRHSMTKLSHMHFVSTEAYARRVRQLGEEAWRVTVSGAPSLDNLRHVRLLTRAELAARAGAPLGDRFLLVTFHPATLDTGDPAAQARALFHAVEHTGLALLVTMPNADPGGRAIRSVIAEREAANPRVRSVENMGTEGYFSAMALADAMVGNSSSGIVEAASFGLPVVNVGPRQDGRVRGANVIDVGATEEGIARGLARALDPTFTAGLRGMANPYGDGHAADRIVARLADVELGPALMVKHFADVETPDR